MTITEIQQALGSWELKLRENTPREILNGLTYFGHVVILPNSVNSGELGDHLLAPARYVGAYRGRSASNEFALRGSGMAFWLGDEDDKGDVFETAVTLTNATFAASVAALLPPSGAVIGGTIHAVPGTYTGTHRWQTPRKALDYVAQTFGAEWRVTNNATLDAGLIANLYVTTPTAILLPRAAGRDLAMAAFLGRMELASDAEDYTTRVVLLAEGEGEQIATGSANAAPTPFNDIRGNDVKMTRVISESETSSDNANLRAQLQLAAFSGERQSISLSTQQFDIKGDFVVGDYLNVYDPDNGFIDSAREVYWEGQPINPVALRCVEMTWPVPEGWTVAFRDTNGVWLDLSPYYVPESGETTIVVGDLSRSLATSEPVGVRPNLPPSGGADTSIPAAPAFLSWAFGAYQTDVLSSTKAVIRVSWSTPLNIDASTITDGSHYEIRYRVSAVLGYAVKWAQLSPFKWGELSANKWGAPLSSPITLDPEWNYINIPWGTNETTILELTPGVTYEFQIRAVDAAYPPHFGPYSASSFQTTTGDLFAPSTPAAPIVASSLIAIQVTHTLGKNSGGMFNLEPDLIRLNVHVGGSEVFYPSDDNKIGELTANIGMMSTATAAVGTFQVPQIEAIWVRVVAVDRMGNKSGPSPAVQATTELIDDQYISNLSVSKLLAGTINTGKISVASLIQVGTGGVVEIDRGIFRVNDASGRPLVQMGLLPDGKYGLGIYDAAGAIQVRAGELVSGGYGMEAVDETGALVSLSTLAFGMESRAAGGSYFLSSGAYVPDPSGLSIPGVQIGTSRRALVILSAEIHHSLSSSADPVRQGNMYVKVIDETTGAATLNPGGTGGLERSVGGNTNDPTVVTLPGGGSCSFAFLLQGNSFFPTAPGKYTFEVWYNAPVGEVYFQDRYLTVMPF